jgi:nucleoside-diphosphate kinase
VELFDVRSRKTFLKRSKVDGLSERDFYLGAKLLIFGRQLLIVDYGDENTKAKFGARVQKTFGMVKWNSLVHLGDIFTALNNNGLIIKRMAMLKLNSNYSSLLNNYKGDDSCISYLLDNIPNEPFVALELYGSKAYECFKDLCSPDCYNEASSMAPKPFDKTGLYCPRDADLAVRELDFIFDNNDVKLAFKSSALYQNSCLCVIKPHVLKDGKLGDVVSAILEGFVINALKMCHLERINCEEFLEVYKGVVPEYESMIMQLTSGPCVALEICNKVDQGSTYQTFRKFCGPMDPEIAKVLRPNTLRARFGRNKIMNAVHCTDLEEDTQLELEYFFKFLQ